MENQPAIANESILATISRAHEEKNRDWTGYIGRVETLLQSSEEDDMSPVERAAGARFSPEDTFFHICGYNNTIQSVLVAWVVPRGFLTRKNARADGSYDVKSESYG